MPDNTISSNAINNLNAQSSSSQTRQKNDELGQDVFLELLVTQMTNQNPLEPQDNSEFVAQLAQFSSVEGIDKLNTSVENMATSFRSGQTLQATSMVGRTVVVDSDTAVLGAEGNISGTAEVPEGARTVTMSVSDASGQLVYEEVFNNARPGTMQFVWDGTDMGGQRLDEGQYSFSLTAANGEATQQMTTEMSANVDSVTVDANGTVMLNLAGIGAMSMSSVREIL